MSGYYALFNESSGIECTIINRYAERVYVLGLVGFYDDLYRAVKWRFACAYGKSGGLVAVV